MEVNMDKQKYRKLSIDFPKEEYVYLKLACTKKNMSIRDFVTQSVMKTIEEYEDELDILALEKITDEDRKNSISWEKAEKELGWDKL